MSGPGSLGRLPSQRYVDVDQRFGPPRTPRHAEGGGMDLGPGSRPLLGGGSSSSSSCGIPQYPAPYATLPLRCPLERPSPSRLSRNAKGASLSQVRVLQEPTWDAERSGVWCDIWASMTLTAGGSVRLSKAPIVFHSFLACAFLTLPARSPGGPAARGCSLLRDWTGSGVDPARATSNPLSRPTFRSYVPSVAARLFLVSCRFLFSASVGVFALCFSEDRR